MIEYPHIDTVFKRTSDGKLIVGDWTRPEFQYLADRPWHWTEKVDGTNVRILWDGVHVRFAGKTNAAQLPPFLLDYLTAAFPDTRLGEIFGARTDDKDAVACLYGEGFGARIQNAGKTYIPDGVGFILFDVRVAAKIDDKPVDLWLERPNVEDIAKKLDVPIVPITHVGTLHEMVDFVRKGYESAVAHSKAVPAEGVVARPPVDLFDRAGRRVITKLKTRDFRRVL